MKRIASNRELLLVVLMVSVVCSLNVYDDAVKVTGDDQFTPSWFNFKRSQERFMLSNPNTDVEIEFNVEQQAVRVNQVSVSMSGLWRSVYQSQTHLIQLIGKGQIALVRLINVGKQSIKIAFNDLRTLDDFDFYQTENNENNKDEDEDENEDKGQEHHLLLSKQSYCSSEDNKVACQISGLRDIYMFYHTSQHAHDFIKLKSQLKSNPPDQIQQLASHLGINLNQIPHGSTTVQSMVTNTLSSLCTQRSEYEGYLFYGLCSNSNRQQIERHYSLLTIDILFKYNSHLAAWLMENFIQLLEEKLFYSFSGKEWVPVPEHVEVFLTYIKYLKQDSQLNQAKIKDKITKVIEIQNGLINNLLLSEVNHLSEEINYRQQNKVHPSILKMLNQVWRTDLPRAKVSSIYAQSFTSDFFYHEKNQKLENSVGKMVWLIKLVNQHIKVIRNYGDSYQKEGLEQLVSLAKVMNGYALDDPKTQSGDFFSIIITQNLRVYSRSLGYESLLPFSYGISPAFPIKTLFNLTTPIGLASMPLSHHKVRDTYNFRGNINLYFNHKILFNMIRRCSENSQLKVYLNGLNNIKASIQNLIASSMKQQTIDQKAIFFTSWNPQGKGMASENYLSILNLSFLKSFETLPEEKDKKTQQSTK